MKPITVLIPSIFLTTWLPLCVLAAPTLSVEESKDLITLSRDGTAVLTYHKAVVPPTEGQDPAYARSGFIHPLLTPKGGVVTGIHPGDHYHHLGLWHAWVNTEHNGKNIDFWNLAKKTGAIRYAKTLTILEEENRVGFTVRQEHVSYLDDPKGSVILEEQLAITARFIDGANVIDYVCTQKNVTDKPLVFPAYRYGGGLAYRAPHSWNADNSDYLTSEGKDRTNSHTTRGKWCALFGPTDKGDATVSILCSPKNHDAPQRMRTWDNGMMFFNYVPIQEHSWQYAPKETYRMAYQLVIEDAKPSKKSIEQRWQAYAGESE